MYLRVFEIHNLITFRTNISITGSVIFSLAQTKIYQWTQYLALTFKVIHRLKSNFCSCSRKDLERVFSAMKVLGSCNYSCHL